MINNVWAMFYATVVGWALHPGNRRDSPPPDLIDLAHFTDKMMAEYLKRFDPSEEHQQWATGQQ